MRALEDDAPAGVYNVADDSELRMADWMELVADRAMACRGRRASRAPRSSAACRRSAIRS